MALKAQVRKSQAAVTLVLGTHVSPPFLPAANAQHHPQAGANIHTGQCAEARPSSHPTLHPPEVRKTVKEDDYT